MIAAFSGCFQGLQGWRGVCLRLQLQFRNGSGRAIVTGVAGQRPLATALCSQSYCSFDWAVFLCSANFVRTAGEPNEMAGRMSACRARQGCTALLSGNIGESTASEDFSLVRTAHPTAGGAVLLGVAAFLHADFVTAWGVRWRFCQCLCAQPRGGA